MLQTHCIPAFMSKVSITGSATSRQNIVSGISLRKKKSCTHRTSNHYETHGTFAIFQQQRLDQAHRTPKLTVSSSSIRLALGCIHWASVGLDESAWLSAEPLGAKMATYVGGTLGGNSHVVPECSGPQRTPKLMAAAAAGVSSSSSSSPSAVVSAIRSSELIPTDVLPRIKGKIGNEPTNSIPRDDPAAAAAVAG